MFVFGLYKNSGYDIEAKGLLYNCRCSTMKLIKCKMILPGFSDLFSPVSD